MERLTFTCRLGGESDRRVGRPVEPRAEHRGSDQAIAASVDPSHDRAAYRWLLAFTVILLFRPQDSIPQLGALHPGDVFGALALITLVTGRLSHGLPPSRLTPELLGVFAFAAVMVATVPLSFWPGGSWSIFIDLFVKIVVILFVMVNTLTTRERLERFIAVIVLGATYVAIRAVFDYARGVNLVEGNRVAGAVSGLFGNPNDMALNLVTFLPLTIAVALQRGRPFLRAVAVIGIPAMGAAIVFSKSRGGLVGLLAMLAVLLYQMRRLRPGIGVLVIAAALMALPVLPTSFTERMASIFDAEKDPSGSREARKTLLREGYAAFLEHPLTGLGAGQFQNFGPSEGSPSWRQTHNAPLQVASELGVAGLIPFGFLVWTAFSASLAAMRNARGLRRNAKAATRARPDWLELNAAMIVAAVTGWFVSAMFASVAYYWTFYLLIGMAGSIRDISVQAAAPNASDPAAGSVRAA
jgi:O-antigen ligase